MPGVDRPLPPGSWAVLPEGGRPVGPAADGRDYPFIAAGALAGVVADLWLAYAAAPPPAVPPRPPLRVAWMYGFDRAVNGGVEVAGSSSGDDPHPGHEVDLLIVDGRGAAVFDSTAAAYYAATAFGPRLAIHEWRTGSAACRVVQHTAVADAADAVPLPRVIRPADGRLDGRASVAVPPRLTSVAVDPAFPVRGDLALAGGYNVALTAAAPAAAGLRTVTRVTVDAAPGGGLGRVPGCDEVVEPELRSINGQVADPVTGNLALVASGCYWARRPRGRAGDHRRGTLQVGHDCAPCCTCADYVALQLAVLAAWDVYEAAAADAAAMNAALTAMIGRWGAQKACREAASVKLNAIAYNLDVDVRAVVANPTDACLYAITLTVSFAATPPAYIRIDPQAAYLVDEGGATVAVAPAFTPTSPGVPGTATVTWPFLPPGVTVGLQLRLVVDAAFTTFQVDAHATAGGTPLAPDAHKTIVRLP